MRWNNADNYIDFTTRVGGTYYADTLVLRNGNVGIGTTSPDEKLDITGGYLKFNGGDYGIKGSASLTYNPVSDHYFMSSGSTKVTIKASGFVGIGTTSPKTSLDIVKDSDIWHLMAGGATKKLLVGGQAASGDVVLQAGAASTPNNAAVTTAYNLCLQRDGGNVGIGTASPGAKLEVAGGSGAIAGTGLAYFNNSDDAFSLVINNVGISSQNDRGVFDARVGGSSVFRINNSGNVGIGVTNPGNKLRVEGSVRVNDSGNGQIFFGTGNLNKIELDGTDMKLSSGGLAPTITMSNQGLIKFGLYGLSGQGTPANLLGVDGSGNVVKTNSFNLILDDTPAASTTSGSGNIVNWSVSETVTAGTLYTVKSNGGWTTTDADIEARSTGMLAIALGSNATAGMLLQGFFYKASHGFTIGLPLYISNTAGAFSTTRPTGTNDYVRIIGYATSANYIYFDPDKTWVKLQ